MIGETEPFPAFKGIEDAIFPGPGFLVRQEPAPLDGYIIISSIAKEQPLGKAPG